MRSPPITTFRLQSKLCQANFACMSMGPPPPQEVTDVEALKALAHPLRQRIQRLLVNGGPATATTLARALGESTGATSYHLRQLARYRFIEEVPELSRGRERWWRMAPHDVRFPRRSQQDPESRAAIEQLNALWSAEDQDALARFEAERDRMGEWGDALLYSRGAIRVTLEELPDFFEQYINLLKRYQRPDDQTPPGARRILTRFLGFPADTRTPNEDGGNPPEEGTGGTDRLT